MFAKAIIFIVSAVQLADLTPKGKYFLIETQGNENTEDIGATEDFAMTQEDPLKPMMSKGGKLTIFDRHRVAKETQMFLLSKKDCVLKW